MQAAILIVAGAAVAGPAMGRTATSPTKYDGRWSVLILTHSGSCDPTFRYGIDITHGTVVNPSGTLATVQGRVAPNGAIRVVVRAGSEWANGSGHLGRISGGGVWQGQGSSGTCAGIWAAQRRAAQTAQTGTPPIYDYAPHAFAPATPGTGPGVAYCEAHFRSYDPATGTYLGFDGRRHRCP